MDKGARKVRRFSPLLGLLTNLMILTTRLWTGIPRLKFQKQNRLLELTADYNFY